MINAQPMTRGIKWPTVHDYKAVSLAQAIEQRRSVRQFSKEPLSPEQISQLFWAAQGISEKTEGLRTAPSAGALYPLTLYLADEQGVWMYHAEKESFIKVFSSGIKNELVKAAYGQKVLLNAPICMIFVASIDKISKKYKNRALPYIYLEAGHAAQNVLLTAVALNLGAVPVGAFDERAVATLLNLSQHVIPVYIIAIGHKTSFGSKKIE